MLDALNLEGLTLYEFGREIYSWSAHCFLNALYDGVLLPI